MWSYLNRLKYGIGFLSIAVLAFLDYHWIAGEDYAPKSHISLKTNKDNPHSTFSAPAMQLLYNATQTEGFVTTLSNPSTHEFKVPWELFSFGAKVTEHLFNTIFIQYIGISRNFLIKFRKSDLIFPFHYYW